MTIDVQINLRIPNVKDPVKDANGYPIVSADVRFIRTVSVPAVPKPGEVLQLETTGTALPCEVLRADWSERDDCFVVACTYAKRSIPPAEYHALMNDPAWVRRPLL